MFISVPHNTISVCCMNVSFYKTETHICTHIFNFAEIFPYRQIRNSLNFLSALPSPPDTFIFSLGHLENAYELICLLIIPKPQHQEQWERNNGGFHWVNPAISTYKKYVRLSKEFRSADS